MKNGNSIFAVLAEALEKNKKLRTILYAVLIILALAIFLTSGLFGGGKNTNKSSGRTEEEQTGEFSNTEEARMLEARLEDILSQMQNAGQVRVMVTFDNAQEKVIAADEQKSSGSRLNNFDGCFFFHSSSSFCVARNRISKSSRSSEDTWAVCSSASKSNKADPSVFKTSDIVR